jgi:hypothetical protein
MASTMIPAELQQLIIDEAVAIATFAEMVSLAQVNEFWQRTYLAGPAAGRTVSDLIWWEQNRAAISLRSSAL